MTEQSRPPRAAPLPPIPSLFVQRDEIQPALTARDYPGLIRLIPPDAGDPVLARVRRFACNILAMRERDAALASEIESVPITGRVRIVTADDGRETLALADAAGGSNVLCPGNTPTAAEGEAHRQLADDPDRSRSICLSGVGDGAVLGVFSAESPDSLGRQRPIIIIEPDTEALRAAMMLRDWSGENGPIRAGRVRWVVGAGWRERLKDELSPDSALPLPRRAVRQCPDPRPIIEALAACRDAINTETAARRSRIEKALGAISGEELAGRLGRIEGARVLLFTTRHSTVLQHSTRDYARAIERLGGVAHVSIEREPWQHMMIVRLLGEVDRFRPDLVLQIDHHRHESPGVVPLRVPFVCIIQDNLGNLMSPDAARKMGPTDFAAGAWVHRYVLEHGYPADRCIEIPRLTRAPQAPAVHVGGGVDVMYVSNHSGSPAQAIEMAAASAPWPAGAALVRTVGEELVALYASGGCVEDEADLVPMISACAARSEDPPPPGAVRPLAEALNVTVNNALYRQQGLRWALAAAKRLGLSVAIYGRGWEEHAEFASAARGPIDYADLPAETARARFCLTLEPYFPTQHQRALDTWMWGGLALIRRRSRERQQAEFNGWLDRLPASVSTFAEAMESLSPGERERFEEVYRAHLGRHAWDGSGDLVALYRRREREGIGDLMRLPPCYADVAFDDEAGLTGVMRTLAGDAERYGRIQRAQHDWVRERFSYERGARRLLEQVADRLGANTPAGS